MNWLPDKIVGILLIPALVIPVVAETKLDTFARAGIYLAAAAVCVLTAYISRRLIRGTGVRPGNVPEIDLHRYTARVAMIAAFVLDAVVLLLAVAAGPFALILSAIAVAWSLLWIPRELRCVTARTSVVIERDPTTVFDFVADMRHEPLYFEEVKSVEKITDGPIGSGSRFKGRVTLADGFTFEGIDEIVDYDRPRGFSVRLLGFSPNRAVFTFDPVGQATQLTLQYTSEHTYAGAVLGSAFKGAKAEMIARRQVAWRRLKQLLESQNGT